MQTVRCSNSKCKDKVIGEIEYGKARFKCKHCGEYTTVEVEHTQQAPQQDIIPSRFKEIEVKFLT